MKALKIGLGVLAVLILTVAVTGRMTSVMTVSRTFSAPVDKVWKLWNDAESMKGYWGPKGYTAPVIKHDFKVGGAFLLSMKSPGGEMFWNAGTYTEIIPNQKVVSLLSFSDENGKLVPGKEVKLPGSWPDAVQVTVQFKDVGGKTLVEIEEVGIPLVMKILSKMGWEQQLDKFETLL